MTHLGLDGPALGAGVFVLGPLGGVQAEQLGLVGQARQGGAVVARQHRLGVQVASLGRVPAEQLPAAALAGLLDNLVRPLLVAAYLPVAQGVLAGAEVPSRAVILLLLAHEFAQVPELRAVQSDAQRVVDAGLNLDRQGARTLTHRTRPPPRPRAA